MGAVWRDGSDRDAAALAGHSLEFNAACCDVAMAIWSARRRAFHESRLWSDLSPQQRQQLVLQAAWILSRQRRELP